MKNYRYILATIALLPSLACQPEVKSVYAETVVINGKETVPTKVGEIPVPEGYTRVNASANSFHSYLQSLELKQENNTVYLYNGNKKWNQNAQYAVIKMDVGNKDLQQCADACMRLRAEYLFSQQRHSDIHFNFTSGDNCPWTKYADGYRVNVSGNKVSWVKSAGKDYSYKNFRRYLDLVFSYAGTASLSKEMKTVNIADIKPGDLFIQGGYPGHAITVMDIATNTNGKKIFMLAQSYMPAQEIHILKNFNNTELNPWYEIPTNGTLLTPEWTFKTTDLKRY